LLLLLRILGVLIPLCHFAGIVAAVHATIFGRTSQGAIAWAMSLIFFPYVALPLYLVFGRQKFYGYVEARRQGDRRIDHLVEKLVSRLAAFKTVFPGDTQRFAALESLTLLPLTGGNAARLRGDGEATFNGIFAAIENATCYVLLQFFIVRDDALGRELQKRLIAKAKAGVKVYFLFDEIGCIRLSHRYIAELREAGVEMRPFNTRRGWWNRLQINFRNHRKIVVADGQIAFVGGHNVGDEYVGKSHFGHWRDTHVEVRGPAVAAVEFSFLQDWHWASGAVLTLPIVTPICSQGDIPSIVVPTGPADEMHTCTLMLLALITSAKKRLWISSPYFVPDETVYDALQLAALRGVDVRIMLPAKPDHILVYLSAFSYLESGESVGVKFYRYRSGFLHQKVWVIDDDFSAVGTANLDNRSMHLNFEITLLFADKAFTAAVADMLGRDFDASTLATSGDLQRRGLMFRFAVRVARLFSPIE
jgi:cardiolipin synthase